MREVKMIRFFKVFHPIGWMMLIFFTVILTPIPASAGQTGDFTGVWIANGTRQVLPFGPNRNFYTFKLSGHVNLKEPIGGELDFWSEVIGISDSKTGTEARCVWRDLDGRKLFIELKTDHMKSKGLVMGTIVGGTEKFTNATGTLSFKWSSFSFYKDDNRSTVSGQTYDLTGNFQLPEF